MAPYIIRYHDPPSDNGYNNYEYRKRNKHDIYNDPSRKWKYEKSSLYGETVYEYDYESEYTRRSYSPTVTREQNDSRRRKNHRSDYHDHQNHHSPPPPPPPHHHHHHHRRRDNNNTQVRNSSPWSEPPLKYGSETQWYEVAPRTTHEGPRTEPRIALLGKRVSRHTHCSCHACPEKSSKTIPSMHYDQLKCPHCAAYAQPTQEEVLAYPWTVQSYRPNRRTFLDNSLPPDAFSIANGPAAPPSQHSKAQSTILATQDQSTVISKKTHSTIITDRSPTVATGSVRSENSSAAPPEPLFRPDRTRNRSEAKAGGLFATRSQRRRQPERQSVMSEVQGSSLDDDVQPIDSISNVSRSHMRAPSTQFMNNYKSSPHLGADTKVDTTYTRDKYFQSMGDTEPRRYIPQPRPAKDTASEISRMLRGEYYDRRTGRTYAYNVNYAPGKIDSVRAPR